MQSETIRAGRQETVGLFFFVNLQDFSYPEAVRLKFEKEFDNQVGGL